MNLAGVVATLLGVHPLLFHLARLNHSHAWRTRGLLTACAALLSTLPFQVEAGAHFWRAAAATIAVSYSTKAVLITRGGVSDPLVLQHFWRFVLWLVVPHDTTWPSSVAQRASNRRLGLTRLGRALGKAVGFIALTSIAQRLGATQAPFFVVATLTTIEFYLFATAIADALASIAMLIGCSTEEIFDFPFLSRSPADFWSRRWNLYVARFGARFIFQPLKSRSATLATVAVFTASAVMHEYIVVAIFGWKWWGTGYMSMFFGLQCLAVLAQHAWMRLVRRKLRVLGSLAVALHLLWFIPTTWFFFAPLSPLLESWGIVTQPSPGFPVAPSVRAQ